MTRSPLAYPLNRSADMETGGAADLQTDIMRFMAILSLCLVAIFALVQSIPLRPTEPQTAAPESLAAQPPAPEEVSPKAVDLQPPAAVAAESAGSPVAAAPALNPPLPAEARGDENVVLTRPKWKPRFVPKVARTDATNPTRALPNPAQPPAVETAAPAPAEKEGFVLRFESDAALAALVSANRIGVYAVGSGRTQRMSISQSRISFWDASVPNSYHEMEPATVPAGVVEALARSGGSLDEISWGVTLPGALKAKLEKLMLAHQGGALIIAASGDIRWEET